MLKYGFLVYKNLKLMLAMKEDELFELGGEILKLKREKREEVDKMLFRNGDLANDNAWLRKRIQLYKDKLDVIKGKVEWLKQECKDNFVGKPKMVSLENVLLYIKEAFKDKKKTESDGWCMLLGEKCYKECPHHHYRKENGCWKEK